MVGFNPNIPESGDLLEDSQGALKTNNQSIDTSFGVDHTTFSDLTANNGKHKQVTIYQVATDPGQTFPAALIYTKNVGVTPNRVTNLYFSSKPETGADVVRQLTGNLTVTTANGGSAGGTINKVVTPWGITIYSGQTGTLTSNVAGVVTFPAAFTAIYGSSTTANVGSGQARASSCVQTATDLTIIVTGANLPVNWIAIGAT